MNNIHLYPLSSNFSSLVVVLDNWGANFTGVPPLSSGDDAQGFDEIAEMHLRCRFAAPHQGRNEWKTPRNLTQVTNAQPFFWFCGHSDRTFQDKV